MTKAERVRALLAEGKTHKEIASEVGCLTAYVRTVRLRAASEDGMSPGERAWRERNADRVREADRIRAKRNGDRRTPEQRERNRERMRERYRRLTADPEFVEAHRVRNREAYRARKAEINARRNARNAERRAIVAAMIEVAHAKT
jgi:hypothetical protein